jgi:hypothetical protein
VGANDYKSSNLSGKGVVAWYRLIICSNKDTAIIHIPSNRLEASVYTTYEKHPMSQLSDKPPELGFEGNIEDREERKTSASESVEAVVKKTSDDKCNTGVWYMSINTQLVESSSALLYVVVYN